MTRACTTGIHRARPCTSPKRGMRLLATALVGVLFVGCGGSAGDPGRTVEGGDREGIVRVATFNVEELSAEKVDSLDASGAGAHPQLVAAAEVVRRVRPDVMVLNETDLARDGYGLDRDDLGRVVRRFQARYLEDGPHAVRFPYVYTASSNTGILSGLDLNADGVVATPADVGTRAHGDDSFGFGEYPGQYAMAVLSRFPLDTARARTFQHFRWRDLPGHHMPPGFYSDSAESVFRLSSKSHWDLPVALPGDTLHLLVSHPTPPVFDGPEDRNGRRNYDEIGFWSLYLDGSAALYDDRGRRGGLPPSAEFVVAGDLNADPSGGEAVVDGTPAISQLLDHPRVRDPDALRGVATAEFLGGARVDYVLPSAGLEVVGAGVFDPDPAADPAGAEIADRASDHRMVWVDLRVPGGG